MHFFLVHVGFFGLFETAEQRLLTNQKVTNVDKQNGDKNTNFFRELKFGQFRLVVLLGVIEFALQCEQKNEMVLKIMSSLSWRLYRTSSVPSNLCSMISSSCSEVESSS